jgi:hypothetical protein
LDAAWHKTMFLRGACPIHNPEKSAEPDKLYWDGCWPSDQYPLVDENGHGFSIAFIPGRLLMPPINPTGIEAANASHANARFTVLFWS